MIARVLVLAMAVVAPAMAARDDPLAGRVAGKRETCITLPQATNPVITDRGTILYRSGRRIWQTRPIGACPSLSQNNILIIEPSGAQLCRNDRFRTLTPNTSIPSGFCRFDAFTAYDRPSSRASRPGRE